MAQIAMPKPATAPMPAKSRLSVRNCRNIRVRAAPIASRIATSLCRADARAVSRLARFAQAINRTKPTRIIKTRKGTRTCCRSRRVPSRAAPRLDHLCQKVRPSIGSLGRTRFFHYTARYRLQLRGRLQLRNIRFESPHHPQIPA